MKSSRGTRFGAFVASVLACSLAGAGLAGAASTATVYAQDAVAWHPASVSIDPGGAVTWENRDTKYPHTVECDQSSSNDQCPWLGAPNHPPLALTHSQPTNMTIIFPQH